MNTLAARVIAQCVDLGLSLAVAESLTGGLVASTLVGVPGASQAFRGGVVAYDTHLKASLLGVDAGLLDREGPVHRHVAEQMAEGVRHACAVEGVPADIGLATTGVAGPDPDEQTGQPAGTVWIAWSIAGSVEAERLELSGSRREIRETTVTVLLERILLNLSQLDSYSGFSRE